MYWGGRGGQTSLQNRNSSKPDNNGKKGEKRIRDLKKRRGKGEKRDFTISLQGGKEKGSMTIFLLTIPCANQSKKEEEKGEEGAHL